MPDKEYYMTLFNMNDTECETSDVPEAQRLVEDEVPVPLPAEAQSGRMTRKRVSSSEETKDATKDTTFHGAVKKKPMKANPRLHQLSEKKTKNQLISW